MSLCGNKARILSASGESYWQRVMGDAQEAHDRFIKWTPVEKPQVTSDGFHAHGGTSAECVVVRSCLPKAVPSEILHVALRIFQPGGTTEKVSVLDAL